LGKGIKGQVPFEDAVAEPRAPHRDLPLLFIAVQEHLKLHALPDPRLLRDRVFTSLQLN
jgi:hypothetical protein